LKNRNSVGTFLLNWTDVSEINILFVINLTINDVGQQVLWGKSIPKLHLSKTVTSKQTHQGRIDQYSISFSEARYE
jgi:hypothetical protein